MNIECIFIGKTREKYLHDGIDDFLKRIRRYNPICITTVKERKGKISDKERMKLEGRDLLGHVVKGSFMIALDPNGKGVSSEGFAGYFSKWKNQGLKNIVFVVGGHVGFSKEVLEKANMVMSLSQLTFTHEMARLILLEQIYRAFSINAGSRYHK